MCRTSFLSLLTLLLTLSLWTACDLVQGNAEGQSFSFQNIEEVRRLDVPESKTAVFQTDAQWRDFWNGRVSVEDGTKPPPPSVDFGTEMVIGLFWGQQSGCSATVEAIQEVTGETGGAVVVRVDDWTDGSICQALVQPRQVIRMKKASGPVMFEGNAVPGQ